MKILLSILALVTLSPLARADVISREVGRKTLHSIGDLLGACEPGNDPGNGGFATSSGLSLYNIDGVVALTNPGTAIGMTDPKRRIGDHCAELKAEVNAILPADLVVTRTVTSRNQWVNGLCAEVLVENLDGKLGSYELTGSSAFVVKAVAADLCAN